MFDALADPALVITSAQHFRETLEYFAVSYLNLSLSADILTSRRNLIAQSERSNVGKLWFEAGPAKSLMLLTQFLERGMRERFLRAADPWLAMVHLIALMESEFMMRRLLGLVEGPPPEEIRAAALRGVDVYLRAYAPE